MHFVLSSTRIIFTGDCGGLFFTSAAPSPWLGPLHLWCAVHRASPRRYLSLTKTPPGRPRTDAIAEHTVTSPGRRPCPAGRYRDQAPYQYLLQPGGPGRRNGSNSYSRLKQGPNKTETTIRNRDETKAKRLDETVQEQERSRFGIGAD